MIRKHQVEKGKEADDMISNWATGATCVRVLVLLRSAESHESLAAGLVAPSIDSFGRGPAVCCDMERKGRERYYAIVRLGWSIVLSVGFGCAVEDMAMFGKTRARA